MSEVKGYIFDYGGTLDTGGNHWGKVLWHSYERLGVPVTEQQFRDAYVHAERTLGSNHIIMPDFTFRQTLETKVRLQLEWLSAMSLPVSIETIASVLTDDVYAQTQEHTAHSREVLMQLKEQYPMVLVSNFYGNIATMLREFGLDGIFQHIIESAVVRVRKPDPRIFQMGVLELNMPAGEVIVVGDSIDKDIIPAQKAGCQTVWMRGEQWTDDPVDESIPDRIITDLKELIIKNN